MKYKFHIVCLQLLTISFVITLSLVFPLRGSAQSSNIETNPIAEQWILEQLAVGGVADLADRFVDEKDRGISASFLENLLTGNTDITITRYGVRIRNAIVIGGVSLENAEIKYEVWLQNCTFKDSVNLANSHFYNGLSLERSNFESWSRFSAMKVDSSLALTNAIFIGQVGFESVEINRNFSANHTEFNAEQEADFNSIQVGGSMVLNKASFAGPVDFGYMQIGTNFDADEAEFHSPLGAKFNRIQVDGSVWLRGATFEGPVDFGYADIGINFEMRETKFIADNEIVETNTDEEVNLFYSKVGGSFILNNVIFARPVDFRYVEIGTIFSAEETQFESERGANFDSMKVRGPVFLNKATFAGPVNFRYADIGTNFEAANTQFNSEKNNSFYLMRAGGTVSFKNAHFIGPVDFRYMDIGDYFALSDALFSSEEETKFNRMRVDGSVYLRRTIFAGPVDFGYTDIGVNFEAQGTQFNTKNHETTSLFYNMWVEDKFILGKSQFCERDNVFFEISDCSKNERILEKQTEFYGGLSLGDSNFNQIIFNTVTWPPKDKTLNLEGMSYKNISIYRGADKDAWQELIALADRSSLNAQTYTTLETYFRNQGYPERADKVYISYKKRELRERLHWTSASWWWNIFLDGFVLYGRSPGRAFIWSAIFVVIGFIVFRDVDKMLPSEKNLFPYHPLWYSFDLFLPFIDLGMAKFWNPKPERNIARNYRRVHMLLGWILIPIALLAITGVIK